MTNSDEKFEEFWSTFIYRFVLEKTFARHVWNAAIEEAEKQTKNGE